MADARIATDATPREPVSLMVPWGRLGSTATAVYAGSVRLGLRGAYSREPFGETT